MTLDDIRALFLARGAATYGEDVTQIEHAVQCAALAEAEDAGSALIAAALLHDVGHLLDGDEAAAEQGRDDAHEDLGATLLARFFGPEVTEPVRLHVPAKRWLCRREPGYVEALSDASRLSLELQGGVYTDEEADAFLASPHARAGIRLRRWDDAGKDSGLASLPFARFWPHVEAAARV